MAIAPKARSVPVGQLKVTFNVRKHLDEDRVIQFAQLMEAGVEFPPIEATVDNEVVDGRTRLEAYKLVGKDQIMVKIVPNRNPVDMIGHAIAANLGGAKPPSQVDLRYGIEQMLLEGASETKIKDLIPLPGEVVRRYITDARSTIRKRRIEKAIDSMVNENKSLLDAASDNSLTLKELKGALETKAKKRSAKFSDVHAITGALGTQFAALSRKVTAQAKKSFHEWEDGVSNDGTILTVLEYMVKAAHRLHVNTQDYLVRFKNAQAARSKK